MADKRSSSPSDELLEQARTAGGDPTAPGAFVPQSPADAYLARNDTDPASASAADGVGAELDASTIAAQLLEAGQIVPDLGELTLPVDADAEGNDPSAPASSLPGWASEPPRSGPSAERPGMSSGLPVGPGPSTSLEAQPEAPDLTDGETLEGDRWSTPTTEWERREAAKQQRQHRRFDVPVPRVRSLISLAVFGFFALGFIVSLVDGRAPIADAAVGDCFIVGDAEEIDEVPVVDCSAEHDSELFARVEVVGLGSGYPGEDVMFDWLFDACLAQFPAYAGESYEESRYWIDMFIPTTDAWDDGDHTGLCTLVVVDDNLEVVTVSGSGRASLANA